MRNALPVSCRGCLPILILLNSSTARIHKRRPPIANYPVMAAYKNNKGFLCNKPFRITIPYRVPFSLGACGDDKNVLLLQQQKQVTLSSRKLSRNRRKMRSMRFADLQFQRSRVSGAICSSERPRSIRGRSLDFLKAKYFGVREPQGNKDHSLMSHKGNAGEIDRLLSSALRSNNGKCSCALSNERSSLSQASVENIKDFICAGKVP
jgi:hypothetical protein